METSVIWTGSEHHFKQMLALRKEGHAQLEIQEMAKMIEEVLPW
jgi:thymidylate synthase ThyX